MTTNKQSNQSELTRQIFDILDDEMCIRPELHDNNSTAFKRIDTLISESFKDKLYEIQSYSDPSMAKAATPFMRLKKIDEIVNIQLNAQHRGEKHD